MALRRAELSLITAVFTAPLIAVSARWPTTAHAVTAEAAAKGFDRDIYTAACGQTGLRLLGVDTPDGYSPVAMWPPRIQGCPFTRCRDCWIATGKKRPRSTWTAND